MQVSKEENDYRARRGIVLLLPLIFGLLLSIFLFYETWVSLHLRWIEWTEAYAHGYIAVAASFYLLCKAISRQDSIKPAPVFLLLLAFFAFLWFLGVRTSTQIVAQASLPLIIWAMVASIYGLKAAVSSILPIALLYFAVPLWEVLNTPLRVLAVNFSEYVLMIFGVPALIDGFKVNLTYGVIEVAGSCSGLNYLVTGLFVGTLYAAVFVSGIKRKVFCVLLAAIMALLVNWFRIASLILIAHYTKMGSSLVYSHHTYGWVLFAVALFLYFFTLERVLDNRQIASSIEDQHIKKVVPKLSASNLITALICAILLGLFPALFNKLGEEERARSVSLAENVYEIWGSGIDDWLPYYHGWDKQIRLVHDAFPEPINMLALIYLYEKQGKELSHYGNRITEDEDNSEVRYLELDRESGLRYKAIRHKGSTWLVAWLFKVERRYTDSPIKLKYLQFIEGGIRMNPYSSAFVSFKVRCTEISCDSARATIKRSTRELKLAIESIQFSDSENTI